MEELLQIGLGLFGGLALFLYGMNLMSNNLQEAAGERMRAILAAVTKNPFFGVLAGALATACAAMMVPAPGLLSMMKGWPSARLAWSANARATTSVGPPAAKPTTSVTGLVG